MSDQYTIETPENISFGYDVAGIGSRFLATLVDSFIQGLVYVFLVIAAVFIFSSDLGRALPQWLRDWAVVVFLLVLFLLQIGYFIAFELFMGGQSPGKWLFKLRVIKENGYPLGVTDSIIRNLIRIIDFFPFAYGVGVIAMFLNDRAKRLGDYAAGTIVVKLRDQIILSDLQQAMLTSTYAPELPGVETLSAADIELIESFFQRRHQLKESSALANTIARNIRARLNSPSVEQHAVNISSEDFLKQVVLAHRKSKQRN
jgi:uncharacterized RDD family membrane protein YckC